MKNTLKKFENLSADKIEKLDMVKGGGIYTAELSVEDPIIGESDNYSRIIDPNAPPTTPGRGH